MDWPTFDPNSLPVLEGTETKQVRLNFAKPAKDSYNAPIILTLAKWAKANGADIEPDYGQFLKDIELADLHRRFKEKFSRLQRVFRQTDGGQAEDKKMNTVYLNRAKGVSNFPMVSYPHLEITHHTHI